MRVLMVTTEYPTPDHPGRGIFVARQVATLRRMGLTVDVLDFTSRCNPANHLRAWRRMREMLAASRYDLVHAQFGHAAPIALLQRRAPVVVTFRGPDLQGVPGAEGRPTIKGRVLVAICRAAARYADQIVVVSPRLGRSLKGLAHHVIPSGVDLDRFRPMRRTRARRLLGWDPAPPVVLFAAQDPSMPNKRYELAREAVALAAQEVPSVRLVTAEKVPPDRMPHYMNASDLLLVTSYTEGSPNVVKEALACNLPVITVDTGDVRIRLQGVSRSVVCAAAPPELARAIVAIVSSGGRSDGRKAVRRLREERQCRRLLKVYRLAAI